MSAYEVFLECEMLAVKGGREDQSLHILNVVESTIFNPRKELNAPFLQYLHMVKGSWGTFVITENESKVLLILIKFNYVQSLKK